METVTDKVIADIKQRSEAGKKKYGKPLHTFNDRDALQDAYEECLDMAQYLKQAIMEPPRPHRMQLIDFAQWLYGDNVDEDIINRIIDRYFDETKEDVTKPPDQ